MTIEDLALKLLEATIIALQITAIHVAFWQGMILGWFSRWIANWYDFIFGKKISMIIRKPLWDCLPCMSVIWTIGLTRTFDIDLIFVVCGICAIIDCALPYSNHDPEKAC